MAKPKIKNSEIECPDCNGAGCFCFECDSIEDDCECGEFIEGTECGRCNGSGKIPSKIITQS